MKTAATVPQPGTIEALTTQFLAKTEQARAGMKDPFGIEVLLFLIGALEVLQAPTKEWDRVAEYVLVKASGAGHFYYDPVVFSLIPYVSEPVINKFLAHTLRTGKLRMLRKIARLRFWRDPTSKEALAIAEAFKAKRMSSDHEEWKELLHLADETDAVRIEELRKEVQKDEEDTPIY